MAFGKYCWSAWECVTLRACCERSVVVYCMCGDWCGVQWSELMGKSLWGRFDLSVLGKWRLYWQLDTDVNLALGF